MAVKLQPESPPIPSKPAITTPGYEAAPHQWRRRAGEFFASYFWIIFKNVIGWILILSAPALGVAVPGPGGLPAFLIGFALVTFPGKRKLTSRVMRGRGLPLEMAIFTFVTAFVAIVTTCILMWFLVDRVFDALTSVSPELSPKKSTIAAMFVWLVVTGLFALAATWIAMRVSLRVMNYILTGVPILRRRMRPWLRKKGLILLPSRRKRFAPESTGLNGDTVAAREEEILEIHPRHQHRLRVIANATLPWAKRALGVAITVGMFLLLRLLLGWLHGK